MKGLATPAYCFSHAITAMDCAVLPRPICREQQQQKQQQQQGACRWQLTSERQQGTRPKPRACSTSNQPIQRPPCSKRDTGTCKLGRATSCNAAALSGAQTCCHWRTTPLQPPSHLISQDAAARPPLAVAHLAPVVVDHPLEAGLLEEVRPGRHEASITRYSQLQRVANCRACQHAMVFSSNTADTVLSPLLLAAAKQ
jgi:hypothetical protein